MYKAGYLPAGTLMNKKLLNKLSKLSSNLKNFIRNNELWLYCVNCQKNDNFEINNMYECVICKQYLFLSLRKFFNL